MTIRAAVGAALLAGILVGFPLPGAAAEPQIHIENPWSRPMAPGGSSGVGYLSIRNDGETGERLIAVEADRAGRVELHRTTVENGVMRMRPATGGTEIPPGETVELEPGGLHIMFLDVAEPFAAGEHIEAVLQFEAAGKVEVRFVVGDGAPVGEEHDHDHDHHDHEH